jgi:hypothetical protein
MVAIQLPRWLAMCGPVLLVVSLASAQDADRIEPHKPLPSTALLLSPNGQGSGFLVDRGDRLLVTNSHVARANQAVDVIFPIMADDGRILASRDFYLKKAQRIRAKCIASTSEQDLAILQLPSLPNTVPEIKLAIQSPKEGERTHLLGNTARSAQAWVYGFGKVKAVGTRKVDLGKGQFMEAQTLLVTADDRIGPGSSGGPVVNDAGELIGVIQSGTLDARHIVCVECSEVRVFLGHYYRNLGTAALAAKDYNQAIARCGKALDANPADALAHHERAAAYSFQQRYEEAIRDYTAAIKLDPKLSRSLRGRASAHYGLGQYDKAVTDCTEAIKIDPNYALAYLSRSRAYEKLGKTDLSKADRDMAIKLDPSLK